MDITAIIELLLGGGVVASLVALLTMRSSMQKARAEADTARAEADRARVEVEGARITNADAATRILNDNIVKPLKDELNETRESWKEAKREIAKNTREMRQLRKAIDAANSCKYSDDCPVLRRVQLDKKREQRDAAAATDADGTEQPGQLEPCGEECDGGDGADADCIAAGGGRLAFAPACGRRV